MSLVLHLYHTCTAQAATEDTYPPRPLKWYPGLLAWQMPLSRQMLRTAPRLAELHQFIVHADKLGSITRQEAVSMIPPVFLKVRGLGSIVGTTVVLPNCCELIAGVD